MAASATILVVDDEKLPRTLLAVNLRQAGYEVIEADGGRTALGRLREQDVDVVLLDLVMPEMDGFQVLRRMKADSELRDVPVVVVSGSDDMNSVVRCIEMGAVDHLSKPFDPALLQVRVRAALAVRQLEQARASEATRLRPVTGPLRGLGREAVGEEGAVAGVRVSSFLGALFRRSRPYRKQTVLFACLTLACLGIEAALPMGFKFVTDDALIPHDFRALVLILGALVIAMLVATLMQIGTDYLYARLAVKTLNDLRFSMYRHLQRLSMSFFSRVSAGEIISWFTTDLAAVENTVMLCLPLALGQFMMVVFTLALLFILEWKLALFAVFGIFVSYRAEQRIEKPAAQADVKMKRDMAGITTVLQDVVGLQQAIKTFRLQGLVAERFKHQMVDFFHLAMRACFLSYLTDRVPGRCAALFGLLTVAGGALLTFFGYLTLGELISFQVLLASLTVAINELTWSMPYLVRAAGGMQKVESLLGQSPEVKDEPGAAALPRPEREIVFENVTFGYVDGQPLLKDLSLSIPLNRSVLLVGPSGSGKSTLLYLLMRFYDPQQGVVRIDGQDLRAVTQDSLRQYISAVFHENCLFNTTVRENIRMGRQGATDEEVEAAAEAVGMHAVIMGFPAGYDTLVGERGGKLSTGHRQRLAIARAILADTPILLLDDATSALDPTTAAAVHQSLAQITRGKTVISVTHHLQSAPNADLILVLKEGRLVESGSRAALLERGGVFASLWQKQAMPG